MALFFFIGGCASQKTGAPITTQVTMQHHEQQQISLEDIFEDPNFIGDLPVGVQLSPDGAFVSFLRDDGLGQNQKALWVKALGQTSQPQRLLTATDLIGEQQAALSEEERMRRERQRIAYGGIVEYQWCSTPSGYAVLLPFDGQLFYVQFEQDSKGHYQINSQQLTDSKDAKIDPKCSPDGQHVAYVSGGNLYTVHIASRQIQAVTEDANDVKKYGIAEFVAQEEMGRYTGFWWSPDAKHLLFTEVDERRVDVKTRSKIYADRTETYAQRYPAAGEENAKVKLHIYNLDGTKRGPSGLILGEQYLARAGWADKNHIFFQAQSRDQKRLKLVLFNIKNKIMKEVKRFDDDAWVGLNNDLYFLPSQNVSEEGEASTQRIHPFIWTEENRSIGPTRHIIYQYGEQVYRSPLHIHVHHIVAFDRENLTVYAITVDDHAKSRGLHAFRISTTGEWTVKTLINNHAWIDAVANASASQFIVTESDVQKPSHTRIINHEGQEQYQFPKKQARWDTLKPLVIHDIDLKADDGTHLNGRLIEPQNREPGVTYPVMTYVYGGPHAQLVTNQWTRRLPFFYYMAERGYGIFIMDNRGSGGREHAFTRSIKNRFGDIEVRDQSVGQAYLKQVDWVNTTRVGVFGWSYGGYLTSLLMMQENTSFAAGVAVAPVTDWTLYDTHYTERYIGTPQKNEAIYTNASVLTYAHQLNKPFYLIHGMADDNVLFENSLMLAQKLQELGTVFSFMAYPGRAHGLAGTNTQKHVYRSIADFFDQHLRDTK